MRMKKLFALLMAIVMLLSVAACRDAASIGIIGGADGPTEIFVTDSDNGEELEDLLTVDGWYYSAEDVSLYLYLYGCLPDNFITKNEARELGWDGGSVEYYAEGYAIGVISSGIVKAYCPRQTDVNITSATLIPTAETAAAQSGLSIPMTA